MGERLGDLQPGEEFVLPWGTRGTFWGLTDLGDADVVLEGKRCGRDAYLSANRFIFRTGRRSPHVQPVPVRVAA